MHAPAEKSEESNLSYYGARHPYTCFPDVDCEYMTRLFSESGMYMSGGMGMTALTWSEIHAYSIASEIGLTGWEAETIRKMSLSYVSWYNRAGKQQLGFPYEVPYELLNDETIENRRAHVGKVREIGHKNIEDAHKI